MSNWGLTPILPSVLVRCAQLVEQLVLCSTQWIGKLPIFEIFSTTLNETHYIDFFCLLVCLWVATGTQCVLYDHRVTMQA